MPYSFSPVCVDTGCEDVQGLQVFRDDRLTALFVRLDSDCHSDHRGCWFPEAGFGRCAAMSAGPFGSVFDAFRWTAEQYEGRRIGDGPLHKLGILAEQVATCIH